MKAKGNHCNMWTRGRDLLSRNQHSFQVNNAIGCRGTVML